MKKLIALLLAMFTLLSLTACGDGTTIPSVPDSTTVPEASDTIDTPGASDESGDEASDDIWQGDYETATFADVRKYGFGSTNWDGSMPLSTTNQKLSIGIVASSYVTDFDTNSFTIWLEEQTGLDLVFHVFAGSTSDVETQLNLMFIGNETTPDIQLTLAFSNQRRAEYLREGYLVNVAGYYMTDSYYWTKKLNEICGDDPAKYVTYLNGIENYSADMTTGMCFGQAFVADNPTDAIHCETHINTEWLKKLNLEVPTTVDELYDVLVAFRDQDPNGNGKKDEVPIMGLTNTNGRGVDDYLINAFVQFAHNRYAMIDDNGVAFSPYTTDEYRQALKFINKLVNERLIRATSFAGNEADLRRMLNPIGDEPYTVGIICAWLTGDFQAESNSIHVYESIPALSDATGKGGYSLFDAGVFANRYCITSSCKDVRTAWRFMDFMCSDEAFMRQRWGQQGVDWDWIENTEFKDMAKGNGIFGGDADWVLLNKNAKNSKWGYPMGIYSEKSPEQFCNPNDPSFENTYYKKSAANVILQESVGSPKNELLLFPRTSEEDEIFQEYSAELSYYWKNIKSEFCMGYKDVNDDAVWNAYLKCLEDLGINEIIAIAQSSFDRQQAEKEAYISSANKQP